jgi:hypothetical protein
MVNALRKQLITLMLLLVSALFGCEIAHAQSSIDLDIPTTQAIANALGRFTSDGYTIKDYKIVVNANSKEIEVIFVPPFKKSSNPVQAAEPSGLPEVHYYLNSSGEKILRRLFGQA